MTQPTRGPAETPVPMGRAVRRVRATVLFVDLVGFTALSEAIGPERAYGITTGCLRILDGIARRHGGSVDKFQGDALMAVFGHPVSRPDAAREAVRAALEMRRAVSDYVSALGVDPPLRMHVGVNTGDMVAGDVRGPVVREFHVLGDAVNVAARLKAKSPIGAIYVGPDTWTETRDDFVWETIPPLKLKGKSKPVPAYAALEAHERLYAHSLELEQEAETPWVGRETELAALRHATVPLRQGQGIAIALVGEEGLGKTRLLEALGRTPELAGITVLRVQPRSAGEPAPGEMMAALLEGLGPAAAGPAAKPAARLVEALRAGPLLLVLEDLERADAASLGQLEALLPLPEDHPLGLVLVGQPGPATDRLSKAAREALGARLTEIRLGPLGAEAARQLVESVAAASELDGEDRDDVLARAAGNPARLLLGIHLAPALASERDQAAQQTERSSDAERRRATILFADITGFTAMTEKLGAERAYPLVAGCLRLLDEVARKHGGTVEKYLGDCVMALFGVPAALEDAPRAAVNAAIEMRRRVREYNREHDLPLALDVHTGIHTGKSIAGDVSGPLVREFAVMGEPVVVAAQLTDLAEAGEVYVGPETWRSTRDRFEFQKGEPLAVAGLAEPVGSYGLRSEKEQLYRRRVGEPSELFSELVGRDAEMACLRERLAGVVGGRGGFVALAGEAGLGKSRLVAELAREAEGRVAWLEGRSLSTGSSRSFHPFADLLRGWCGIEADDESPVMAEKLRAALAALLPGEEEEFVPFLAAVMGVSLGEENERRLAEAGGEVLERAIRTRLTRVLERLSEQQPLVLVLDDLHWADLSSIELALALAPVAEDCRVLFLHVFRPHFGATSDRVLQELREKYAERLDLLELQPLAPEAVRRLINNLFRDADIPQRVRAMIAEKAAGNPFYLEEVVRSLIEQGAVVREGQSFRATPRIHETEIPGSVEEVVRSRIDRLPLRRRELVQVAAVIGRSFNLEVLRRIFPDEDNFGEDLEALQDGGFLVPWEREQGSDFAFKHPLLQEVAYEGQLEERRRQRHHAVAEAIEQEFSEGLPGYHAMLAYHFGRGGDVARAEGELFRAGDEAARSAASNEALQFFREASRLYLELHSDGGDPERRAKLEKNLGLALYNRGQLIEAEEHFNTALRLFGERVPRSQTALLLRFARNLPLELARLWLPRWRRRAATDRDREVIAVMYRRAEAQTFVSPTRFLFDTMDLLARLDTVDPSTVPNAGGMFSSVVGIFSFGGLSFGIGERFLERSAPLVKPDDVAERLTFGMMKHLHHFLAGDWSDAHCIDDALLEEGLRELRLWSVANYLGLETEKRIRQGRWDDARALMARTSHLWETFDYDLAKTNHYAQPVFLAIEQRNLEEARAGAEVYRDENPEDLLHILAHAMRAEAQILLGDLDAAARSLSRGEEIVRRTKFPPPFHLSSHRNAQLLFQVVRMETTKDAAVRRDAAHRGRGSARAALRVTASVSYRRPQALRLAGRLAWLRGRPRAALRLWERGLEGARALGMRPEEARIAHEIGVRLAGGERRLGDRDAAGWRAAARERYDELGLAWDRERLDAGLAP